ncbi:MAG: efflux RND transporter periplasmic adaptor subunit [Gemmataceae bacterium]|nr:efflux RND transporter periplasmic adaptor subunit [Gemmataceae bacterium]MDW8243442.1 efflux RND transporter periplasmic adaptor subunit [Thermogemmata sp.]
MAGWGRPSGQHLAIVARGARPRSVHRSILWAGVIVLVAVVGCQKATPTSELTEQAVPVETVAVQSRALMRSIAVMGTLNAYEELPLAAKVDGRVLQIYHDVGDRVAVGTVLMELDSTDYRLAVAQARAAYEGELQRLKLDRLPLSVAEFERHLVNIDAVAQARANWELAEKELARAELEIARGVGSPQNLDSARSRVKAARAAVELAETEARVVWANARRLKAVVEDAEQRLEETQLRVPAPPLWYAWSALIGVAGNPIRPAVAHRHVSLGEMVRSTPVTLAYRLVVDQILKLRVAVPEKYRPQIKRGDPVELHVDAWPQRTFHGRVVRIAPLVDMSTRTFPVEIEVPNYDHSLLAGNFAQARILSAVTDTILTVPPAALVSFAGVHKVFVVREGQARSITVEVGLREKEWVEIRGPLQAGESVVISGQLRLIDGTPVRVKSPMRPQQ